MKKYKIITTEILNTKTDYSKHSNRFKYRNIDGLLNDKFIFVRTNEEELIYSECIKSPLYFIENIINVKLFNNQINALEKIHNNPQTYILHSRQVGISKLLEWYILWRLCFTNDVICFYMNYDKRKISNIGEMYRKLPYYIKPNILEFNSKIIKTSKSELVLDGKLEYDFIVYDDSYNNRNITQLKTSGKMVASHGLGGYGGIIDFLKDMFVGVITNKDNYMIIQSDRMEWKDIIGDSYRYEYGLDIIDFLLKYKK